MGKNRITYDKEKLPCIVAELNPEWVDMYDSAWRTAFNNIEYFDDTDWKPQMTCMPAMGRTWQWDSCFMSFIANYSNNEIEAMNNIDNLLSQQDCDGYISMCYFSGKGGAVYDNRINPPLYAWAEWEHYNITGDDHRFERVLTKIVKLYDWIKANRRRANGLYWFEDTGSSGMDNSPRSGYFSEGLRGSDVCFIDLACQQALSAMCIAKIAEHIGNMDLSARFNEEYDMLKTLINERHWNEKFGFYFDLFDRCGDAISPAKFINVKTAASFWPLLSGLCDDHKIESLCRHLQDPDEFMTLHPIPTLSKDDPNYRPLGGYWLGGVWAPTNYMIAKGLKYCGREHLARDLAIKHLQGMIRTSAQESYDSIWECYSPEYYLPATNEEGRLVRKDFVGWSGLGPIAMLIENVLGFTFDASANTIYWSIGTKGRHGIENFLFNGKKISLICEAQNIIIGESLIRAETDDEVKIEITSYGKSKDACFKTTLKPGRSIVKF